MPGKGFCYACDAEDPAAIACISCHFANFVNLKIIRLAIFVASHFLTVGRAVSAAKIPFLIKKALPESPQVYGQVALMHPFALSS